MFRYTMLAFLAGALMLGGYSPSANAQWRRFPRSVDLSGTYVNQSNGGLCSITRQGRSYIFVNENGSEARFVYDGPRRLRMIDGEWYPNTLATVQDINGTGRLVIRFDSTGQPGFWVRQS